MASGTAEEFAVASRGAAAQPALSSAVAEAAKRRDERIFLMTLLVYSVNKVVVYIGTLVSGKSRLSHAFLLISLTLRMRINAKSTSFWRL